MPDEGNMTWRKVITTGSHPAPRDSHSMSSWNNNLIVLGGEDAANSFLSDIYILDTGMHGECLHPFRLFSENSKSAMYKMGLCVQSWEEELYKGLRWNGACCRSEGDLLVSLCNVTGIVSSLLDNDCILLSDDELCRQLLLERVENMWAEVYSTGWAHHRCSPKALICVCRLHRRAKDFWWPSRS